MKKKPEEMLALKDKFISRAKAKGYDEQDLLKLFNQFEGFSSYSFNKSHSICYSYLTAYTAWLSHYYPYEFFTSLLTIDSEKIDDIRRYINAIKKRNITIVPPDINKSRSNFTIQDNKIVFGLAGIRGVGKSFANKIITRRPKAGYKSFGHFVQKNIDIVNKKTLEQYSKAGVFREFGMNKRTSLLTANKVLYFLSSFKEISNNNITFFDLLKKYELMNIINEFLTIRSHDEDDLKYEIDTLGLYITKHPLEDLELTGRVVNVEKAISLNDSTPVSVLGAICNIEIRKTKAKTNMASFLLTSAENSIKCIIFPKNYPKFMAFLQEGLVVKIDGLVREETSDDDPETESVSEKILLVNSIDANFRLYTRERIIDNSFHEYSDLDLLPKENNIILKLNNCKIYLTKE